LIEMSSAVVEKLKQIEMTECGQAKYSRRSADVKKDTRVLITLYQCASN